MNYLSVLIKESNLINFIMINCNNHVTVKTSPEDCLQRLLSVLDFPHGKDEMEIHGIPFQNDIKYQKDNFAFAMRVLIRHSYFTEL